MLLLLSLLLLCLLPFLLLFRPVIIQMDHEILRVIELLLAFLCVCAMIDLVPLLLPIYISPFSLPQFLLLGEMLSEQCSLDGLIGILLLEFDVSTLQLRVIQSPVVPLLLTDYI